MIDWVAVSIDLHEANTPAAATPPIVAQKRVFDHVRAIMPELGGTTGEKRSAQRPFKECFRLQFATVHWHNYLSKNMSHVLIVLDGHDCEAARVEGFLYNFAEKWQPRITRIDIAHDIKTNADVVEFAEARTKQVSSYAPNVSPTGTTYYLGSRKADRMCRVYRWSAPHPRHEFLRIEYEFKRAAAREIAARATSAEGVDTLITDLGATWGWTHKAYDRQGGEKVKAPVDDRSNSRTVLWLLSVCAPSLAAQMRAGNLTAEQFLDEVAKAAL